MIHTNKILMNLCYIFMFDYFTCTLFMIHVRVAFTGTSIKCAIIAAVHTNMSDKESQRFRIKA